VSRCRFTTRVPRVVSMPISMSSFTQLGPPVQGKPPGRQGPRLEVTRSERPAVWSGIVKSKR